MMKTLEIVGGGVNRTTVDGRAVDHDPGDTLKVVLEKAGLLTGDDPNKIVDVNKISIPAGKTFDGFIVKVPNGTPTEYVKINTDGSFVNESDKNIPIPIGTKIEPIFISPDKDIVPFTVKVTGADGEKYEIPVELSKGETEATWAQIKTAAAGLGIKLFPDGYTLDKVNGNSPDDNAKFTKNTEIKLTFTKNVNYKVGSTDVTVTLSYPETQATWTQIKAAAVVAGVAIDGKTWQDQNGENVSDSKKYPAGTTFSERVDPPADGMMPEGLDNALEDVYNNPEADGNHRNGLDMSYLLTAWSCKSGDLYQFLIFDPERDVYDDNNDGNQEILVDGGGNIESPTSGNVFYGSYKNSAPNPILSPTEAKAKAEAKAKEAKQYYLEKQGYDYKVEDDCNTGFAWIEGDDNEKITIGLLPDTTTGEKASSSSNIEGTFYMSPKGELIVRPEQDLTDGDGNVTETVEKTGFLWEYGLTENGVKYSIDRPIN